jgi:hypothetical protein
MADPAMEGRALDHDILNVGWVGVEVKAGG